MRNKKKAVWLELEKRMGVAGKDLIEEMRTGFYRACEPW